MRMFRESVMSEDHRDGTILGGDLSSDEEEDSNAINRISFAPVRQQSFTGTKDDFNIQNWDDSEEPQSADRTTSTMSEGQDSNGQPKQKNYQILPGAKITALSTSLFQRVRL